MTAKNQPVLIDKWLIVSISVLLGVGVLMVCSASMVISDKIYGYPFHYLIRQLAYIVVGLILAGIVFQIPIKVWEKYSGYLMIFSILALILVLVPWIGKSVNGSRRWLHFGFFSLQVTELVKLFTIVYLASYLVRFQHQIQQGWFGALKPMFLLGFIAILLLLEPDFGTFVVITMTFLTMLFVSGVRLSLFALLLTVVAVGLSAIAFLSPYRLARLTTFIDPWATQFGSGYQLTQSLIAFGRGGAFGVGLGNSVQKLFYLPEAHTDFIFAVLGEELGLVGAILLLAVYVVFIVRIFVLSAKAYACEQYYASNLSLGIGCWLCSQVLINVGVSVGVLPTKGLTLPFISYGGSSLIVNCIALAIVLRVAYEASGASILLSPAKKRSVYRV